MTTKLFSKPQLQQVIRDMRAAGYDVQKISGGYECHLNGELMLKAMMGARAYLVRYNPELLTATV